MRASVALRGLLGVAALLAAGCSDSERIAGETLVRYMEAVQSEDWDALFCLSTGAAAADELGDDPAARRAAFAAWARAWLERYTEGRDEGLVDTESNPIAVIELFALGRGTWYSIAAVERIDDDTLRVATALRFGYDQANLSRLSPGTTFYLAADPPGRVRAVQVPAGPREIQVEVLESVNVEWMLSRAPAAAGCAAGRWTVAEATPVPDSATTTSITWVF